MEVIFQLILIFVPSLVAFYRGHHSRLAILVLNFLTWWTIVGWIAALAWSLTKIEKEVM